MNLRFISCIFCCSLATLACAGRADTNAGSGGDGGASVAGSANAGDTFRSPSPVTSSPAILGASPVKCAGVVTPDAAIVRACVLRASCSTFAADTSLSACVAQDLPESGALPTCVIGAQTCAEIDACLGTGFYPDPCQADDPEAVCVGTKIVYCSDTPRDFKDCAKRGATCAQYSSSGDGTLDAADCAVSKACGPDTAAFVCEGTKRILCHQGIGFGEDCAARGLKCVASANGAVCAQTPATCAEPGVGSCDKAGDGSYCNVDGRTLTLSCAPLGFECAEAPLATYGVQCADPSCSPEDAAQCREECDGPMAHLCLAGHRYSVDCRSYGFQACRLETLPDEGDRVRCGPF